MQSGGTTKLHRKSGFGLHQLRNCSCNASTEMIPEGGGMETVPGLPEVDPKLYAGRGML
jgi:hypothetical protein